MASIIYNKISYNSKSDLVRVLLIEGTKRKSEIARIADVIPTTVEDVYRRSVRHGLIDDYYPAFREQLKKNRLKGKL
jgi:hypothetical protein